MEHWPLCIFLFPEENFAIGHFHGKTMISVASTGKVQYQSFPQENHDISHEINAH